MDLVAIGVHHRPGGAPPPLPSVPDLLAAFEASGQQGVTAEQLAFGQTVHRHRLRRRVELGPRPPRRRAPRDAVAEPQHGHRTRRRRVRGPGHRRPVGRHVGPAPRPGPDDRGLRHLPRRRPAPHPRHRLGAHLPARIAPRPGRCPHPHLGVADLRPPLPPPRRRPGLRAAPGRGHDPRRCATPATPVPADGRATPGSSPTAPTPAPTPSTSSPPPTSPRAPGTGSTSPPPSSTPTATRVTPSSWEFRTGADGAGRRCDDDPYTADELWIRQAYRDVLGREADAPGLESWTYCRDRGADERPPGQQPRRLGREPHPHRRRALRRAARPSGRPRRTGLLGRGAPHHDARHGVGPASWARPRSYAQAGGTDADYVEHLYERRPRPSRHRRTTSATGPVASAPG